MRLWRGPSWERFDNGFFRDAGAKKSLRSWAIGKTEEPGRNPIYPRQLIADEPHAGEGGDPIEAVIARADGLVPHGDGDINLLQVVQGLTHVVAVGNAWRPLHPVAYRYNPIARVLGVDVSCAVARRRQTRRQSRFTGA